MVICLLDYLLNLNPVYQSFLAGFFTFFITALGSSIVFFFQKVKRSFLDGMMALSAGIMISAAFFSLLNPAIEIAESFSLCTWLILISGFLIGGILLLMGDNFFDYLAHRSHFIHSQFKRSVMLFLSITLHNIPEGLVVGVAFGAIAFSPSKIAALLSAITLTIGIALQNFPEGSAISLPMRRDGVSPWKAFLWGVFSAIVEPIFAVVGAILVLKIQILLPFIMSLAAGAMIFVVLQELLPDILQNKRKDILSFLVMIGFSIMMFLEIALG